MKIQLKGKAIPRSEAGDPAFRRLHDRVGVNELAEDKGVSTVFSNEEIVELVNRALYQLEYQHASHKRRGQEQRDRERALRETVKRLFHISWLKATPEQIAKAKEEVEKG